MHVIIPDIFLESESLPEIPEVFSPSFLLQEPGLTQEWKEFFATFPETWKCLKVDEKEILLFQENPYEKLKLVKIEDDNAEHLGEGGYGSVQKVQVGDIGLFAVKEVDITLEDAKILLQRETSQELFDSESAQMAHYKIHLNFSIDMLLQPSTSLNLDEMNLMFPAAMGANFLYPPHFKSQLMNRTPPYDEIVTALGNFYRNLHLSISKEGFDSVPAEPEELGNSAKIFRSRCVRIQNKAKGLADHDFFVQAILPLQCGTTHPLAAHNFPFSTWIKINLTQEQDPPEPVTLVLLNNFYPYTLEDYMKQKCMTQVPKDGFMRTRIAEVMLQLVEQVSAIHQINYIHRDIKPSNIFGDPSMPTMTYITKMLTNKTIFTNLEQLFKSSATAEEDLEKFERFYPHLGDFSVARCIGQKEEDMVARSIPPVNRKYCAPELLAGSPCSKASDVYALGIIFFELLTGKPYERDAGTEDFEKLYKEEAGVVSQMLEPDPSQRIQAPECGGLIEKLLPEPEYSMETAEYKEMGLGLLKHILNSASDVALKSALKAAFETTGEPESRSNPGAASEMEDGWIKDMFGDNPVPEGAKEIAKDAFENVKVHLTQTDDEAREMQNMLKVIYGDNPVPEGAKESAKFVFMMKKLHSLSYLHCFLVLNSLKDEEKKLEN